MGKFILSSSTERQRCDEFSLVLRAMRLDSEVLFHQGKHYLLVDERNAQVAYTQLKQYLAENATAKPAISQPLLPLTAGYLGAYIYAMVLLLVGFFNNTTAFGNNWFYEGLAHSEKIVAGEWWRSVTALTLHADIGHLAGNIGFGLLFGLLVAQYIGSGAAWFSIVLAGSAGNMINAYIHQTLHQSVGASTMVFGALGLLGVLAMQGQTRYRHGRFRRWLPLASTFALLAFVGTAGERTDIFAHLWGYLCGVIGGVFWLLPSRQRAMQIPLQLALGLACLLLICWAWYQALI